MRYRYQVRRGSQPLSRHTSNAGLADGLAAARSRATLEGWDPREAVPWDCLLDREAGRPDQPESDGLYVHLTSDEKSRLRDLAGQFGYRGRSGRFVGQPAVGALLRAIADGELVVTRRES